MVDIILGVSSICGLLICLLSLILAFKKKGKYFSLLVLIPLALYKPIREIEFYIHKGKDSLDSNGLYLWNQLQLGNSEAFVIFVTDIIQIILGVLLVWFFVSNLKSNSEKYK